MPQATPLRAVLPLYRRWSVFPEEISPLAAWRGWQTGYASNTVARRVLQCCLTHHDEHQSQSAAPPCQCSSVSSCIASCCRSTRHSDHVLASSPVPHALPLNLTWVRPSSAAVVQQTAFGSVSPAYQTPNQQTCQQLPQLSSPASSQRCEWRLRHSSFSSSDQRTGYLSSTNPGPAPSILTIRPSPLLGRQIGSPTVAAAALHWNLPHRHWSSVAAAGAAESMEEYEAGAESVADEAEGPPEGVVNPAEYSVEQIAMQVALDSAATLPVLHSELERYYEHLDVRVLLESLDRLCKATPSEKKGSGAEASQKIASVLAKKYLEMLPSIHALDGVKVLHSFAQLRHAPGGDEGMQRVASTALHVWLGRRGVDGPLKTSNQPIAMVDLLWALGKLKWHDAELNTELAQALTSKIKTLPIKGLSKVADACAKHNLFMYPLLSEVVEAVRPRVHEMPPGSLTALVSALGTLQFKFQPEFNDAIVDTVSRRLQKFSNKQITDVLQGFFLIKHQNAVLQELLRGVSAHMIRGAATLSPMDISNIAYIYALFKYNEPDLSDLCNALCMRATRAMDRFTARHTCILLYSLGRLEYRHVMLLESASWHLLRILPQCTIQNLSNGLWGLSKLRRENEVLPPNLQMLYSQAATTVKNLLKTCPSEFHHQNFADLAWAFSVVNQGDDELFQMLAHKARDVVPQMSLRCLVELPWAMANASCLDPVLFTAVEKRTAELIQDCGPDFLSRMLWAFAVVEHKLSDGTLSEDGVQQPDFMMLAAQQVEARWDGILQLTGDKQATLIWAFHKLGFMERHPEHGVWKLFRELLPESAQLETAGSPEAIAPEAIAPESSFGGA